MQKLKTKTLHLISTLHSRKDRFIILALFLLVLVPTFVFTLMNTKSSKASVDAKLYWGFDEGYGTTANDGSGNSKNGTITGATWTDESNCYSGKCLSFNGSNNYVSRAYSSDSALDPSNAGFSVSAWFRHPSTVPASGTHMLIARYSGAGYKVYMNTSGFLCFGIDDSGTWRPLASVCSTSSYADSKWHFIEAVKNANTSILLYIDGTLINTTSLSSPGSLSGSSPTFYVGIDSDGTSNAWSGFIDEVKYLNGTRSASDVQTDFNARSSVKGSDLTVGPSSKFLSDGLVAYWKEDEGSGTTLTDSSGNGLTATKTGTSFSYVSGKFGNAVNHAGTSQEYYSFSNTNIGTTNTVSYWIKFNSTGTNNYVEIGSDQAGHYASYIEFSSNLWYYSTSNGNNVSVSISGLFSTGTWYFLTISRNNSSVSFYKNGVQVGTTQTLPSNDALTVGALYNHKSNGPIVFPLDGAMDEIRIYNRSLSSSEVQQLYNWAPGPIGYWKFDEGSGNTANDSSTNGNSGTVLLNSDTATTPTWATGKFGDAISLSGTQQVKVGNVLDTGASGNISVSLWIKPSNTNCESGGNCQILGKTSFGITSGTTAGYALTQYSYNQGGDICFDVSDGNSAHWYDVCTPSNVYNANTWYHIEGVYDRTNSNNSGIYINGTLQNYSGNSANLNSTLNGSTSNTNNLRIGMIDNNSAGAYPGLIDDVRIYNYARTPGQIIQDMNAGHAAPGSPVGSSLVDYNFDEGFGSTLNNIGSLGSTANATTSGTLWNPNGKFGSAIQYDGSSSFVSSPQLALLSSDTSTYTSVSWDGWFNPSSSIASKTLIIKNNEFRMTTNSSGNPQCEIYSGSWQTAAVSSSALPLNNWSHILCTYDGANINIYVNGVNTGTTAQTGAITSSASTGLNIGWNAAGGGYFSGLTDESKIYSFALIANQIQSEYNDGMAQILGENSTVNSTASDSAASSFCVPGDSSTCNPPIGWWKFDENQGTSAHDFSGNNQTISLGNGTPANYPSWVTGKYDSALGFNGTSSFAEIAPGVAPNLSFTTGNSITLEAWIKSNTNSSSAEVIYEGHDDGNYNDYAIEMGSPASAATVGFRFRKSDGSAWDSFDSSNTYNWTDGWHHIAFTFTYGTGSSAQFYRDGIPISGSWTTGTGNDAPYPGDKTFLVGRAGPPYGNIWFNGSIDEVRIYNYIRTATQITYDYNRGASVAQYDFDECSGSTLHNNSLNSSGQATGMDGTITSDRTIGNCQTASTMWGDGAVGKFNSALGFDGTGDYVNAGAPSGLNNLPANGMTISAWIKPTLSNSHWEQIVDKIANATPTAPGWLFEVDPPNDSHPSGLHFLQTGTGGGNGNEINAWSPSGSITSGVWQHVVVIYNGSGSGSSGVNFYINGTSRAVTYGNSFITRDSDAAEPLTIGCDSVAGAGECMNGLIDDVRIYNYTLTATQVQSLYNDNASVKF